jgi:adenylate kinase family enzyme
MAIITMNLKTFILIGRSGCGKGTQAMILEKFLKNQDPQRGIFHLETGARFREFIKGDSYSSRLAREVSEIGGRQPDFLAVWNWTHLMLEQFTGNEHIILDGTPRSYEEALVLDTAMTFYKRLRPTVIYLDVSRKWSEDRILSRAKKEGRSDDQTDAKVQKRLDWFETEVMRGVKFFEQSNGYNFIHVNGEQSIEKVAQDIQALLVV